MWLQVRLAAERGLGLKETFTTPLDALSGAADAPKPPSFAAMLRAVRSAHPALRKPPVGNALAMSGRSMHALLRFLETLDAADEPASEGGAGAEGVAAMEVDGDDASAEGDDGMEVDLVEEGLKGVEDGLRREMAATRDKFAEGHLLLLEHALVRYAPLQPLMTTTKRVGAPLLQTALAVL